MNIEKIYAITFLIYYLIATFLFCNILFNPRVKFTFVNKKTRKEVNPPTIILILYCLLWIIFIPLTKFGGEENDE